MKRARVVTIVGTRPEIIKLSRVIAELDKAADHHLIHTGQNYAYELNEIFFKELRIRRPNHFLEAAGKTSAETIANVIAKSDALLARLQPDAVLLLGDTNSCLSVLPAKRRHIPIFHMEAGNRCFDARVPEEINRKVVDHLSDVNLPYTEHARRYLVSEGLRPDLVIKTGSPMREVLSHYQGEIAQSTVLADLSLSPRKYFVVSAHREETVDDPERLSVLLKSLSTIAGRHRLPMIFSTHPRTQKRLAAQKKSGNLAKYVRFLKPLGFPDYVMLQKQSFCVLSDSGTLTEESGILGFPGVMLRETHERPEGMDEASVVMGGIGGERLLQAVDLAAGASAPMTAPADYGPTNVSKKVVRIILSYIDYVNRVVWKK